jgi:hypothetical protein
LLSAKYDELCQFIKNLPKQVCEGRPDVEIPEGPRIPLAFTFRISLSLDEFNKFVARKEEHREMIDSMFEKMLNDYFSGI